MKWVLYPPVAANLSAGPPGRPDPRLSGLSFIGVGQRAFLGWGFSPLHRASSGSSRFHEVKDPTRVLYQAAGSAGGS